MAPLLTNFSLSLLTLLGLLTSGTVSTTFTFLNKCEHTVWPGILSNAGVPTLPTTGFALQKGETKTLTAPTSWGGRFWGRTLCSHDSTTGKFTCETADCGSGKLECSGSGAAPPATLAEFTLNGDGGLDFYDVSLVDGYNLPMVVVPQRGSGTNCTATGCVVDLNGLCPSELRVNSLSDEGGAAVACKSACEAFQQPQYCCSGAYATPDTCKPSSYSQVFKSACPTAYSYAYDDRTSTFTCHDADYTITFCPAPNTSQKASLGQSTQPAQSSSNNSPEINSTMVYEGASDADGGLISSAYSHVSSLHAISGVVVGVAVAAWQLWQLFV